MQKSTKQIHYNMPRIRSKDTKKEVALRKELWSRGLRYQKIVKDIPGKPDIAFIGKKVAVFCDSEFLHGYDWGHRKDDIKTRREFWIPKIEINIERDYEVNQMLEEQGWIVLRFWGKQIQKNLLMIDYCMPQILADMTAEAYFNGVMNISDLVRILDGKDRFGVNPSESTHYTKRRFRTCWLL